MKLIFIISVSINLAIGNQNDYLDNFEEVPPPPPQTIGSFQKCGENEQKGKFMCVPYFNCDPTTNTITENPLVDGSGSIKPKLSFDRQCDHFLQVCCQIRNGTTPILEFVPTAELEIFPKCGEFPWVVSILNSKNHICSGSLISPVVILTAAHCVESLKPENITIRVGDKLDIQTENGTISYQEREVSKIIIHEYFMKSTLYNDVALLILKSSLSKTDNNVGTVCIPANNEDFEPENCMVTGWNKTKLSIVPNKKCQTSLRKKLGNEFILDNSFICADGKPDPCLGDGGSSLVCLNSSNNESFYQVGIVSWGVGCGENYIPGVYANVTLFSDWIDYKIREMGYASILYNFN